MDNMAEVINYHNKHVASKKDQGNRNLCSRQNHDNYPLENKCVTFKIVYSTKIITDKKQPSKIYLGMSETEFKTRFNNHQIFFRYGKDKKL